MRYRDDSPATPSLALGRLECVQRRPRRSHRASPGRREVRPTRTIASTSARRIRRARPSRTDGMSPNRIQRRIVPVATARRRPASATLSNRVSVIPVESSCERSSAVASATIEAHNTGRSKHRCSGQSADFGVANMAAPSSTGRQVGLGFSPGAQSRKTSESIWG